MLVLVVGIGALAWMMHELGWRDARDVFENAGAWFPILVGLDLISMCFDAAGIHAFMQPESRMVSFWRVLAAQAAGRAINLLTPGGALGEPTKVTMLVGHAPKTRVISAIILYDLATLYMSVAILAVGVPITLLLVDLPHNVAVLVWTTLAILLVAVGVVGWIVHRGAIGSTLDVLATARVIKRERAEKWKKAVGDVDAHLRELHSNSAGTRTALVHLVISRLFTWAATAVTLHVVGVELSAKMLVGVLSVGVLVNWISGIIPLGLGIADGSNYALFDALGASGANGVFVTLLNRARLVTVALLGLLAMGIAHAANRVSIARRHRKFAELQRSMR
jgi:uncharacterized protein (TIRG00374 family)